MELHHRRHCVFLARSGEWGSVYRLRHSKVYALNASTGADCRFARTGGVQSSPAVANRVVHIGSGDYNVYALNASTGVKLWSYAPTGAGVYSSPAVANGVVYVGSLDNNVYAFGLPSH